ncbi:MULTISPECIES: LCP family protein [unclassified Streptomyces]|uniref:LCP family protein n=1 Tax=unclassified Streptomyces TaxID=2593676 RepID=UPI0024751AF5|nr:MULTISPECIES: LCP family protein [unclassified Streptomyces]MDH6447724.1 LCP family protein required for cell wall assembly [Streptomyces sp. SAI-119]MDH6501552.1 LCP family protein required for cell wall assembly [Streptomyces sp. SAI-149]
MSDRWDGPGGQATRSRTGRVPGQRESESGGMHRPGGRAAARAAARSHGGKRSRRRARPVRRGKRVLKIAGICLALLVLGTAGAGWWFYQHLNGNINSVSLNGKGGAEKADAFGRTPINILVMGSDGRTSKADCKLGGGCSRTGVQTGNGNADVQMVVHISADRSNATVMSIPRDTMVNVPACKDSESGQSTSGYYGQINSALQYGPACQVATIHQLTGIPIDHFVKLDFSGVVKMSDAVGGVSVCVDHNVYDTYSHLKLSKGTHTLKGEAALEFVRSRHGFGDGSDLGRTVSQHIFLSAMIRKFKSAGTLTDPTAVYDLADAATKALTVDDGLGSVKKLIGLADDVNKVPTKRMTFTTMQTAADPNDTNRVVVGAGAKALFTTIADDQSLTTGSGKKSSAASATASAQAVPASEIAVTVENGTEITGRASDVANALTGQGFSSATTTANAPSPATTTTLTYGTGHKAEAQTAAKALGLPTSHLKEGTGGGLTLVIGSDWTSGTTFPGGSSSAAPADTKAAVSNAHAQTADEARTCAKVSPYKTVSLNGVPMTPEQAYAAASGKKDSDE